MCTNLNKSTCPELADPIQITQPEPWQWRVLATALWDDPYLRFVFGNRRNEKNLLQFMEAYLRGSLESAGSVFISPDQHAVLIWSWYGEDFPDDRKQQMFEVLGKEGTERYLWFRRETDISIDPNERSRTMRPNLIGVLPQVQCRGYGSHLLKWTLNHFDRHGYSTPFLVASTKRSAKLYGPLLDFHAYKEVALNDTETVTVMKRNVQAAWHVSPPSILM